MQCNSECAQMGFQMAKAARALGEGSPNEPTRSGRTPGGELCPKSRRGAGQEVGWKQHSPLGPPRPTQREPGQLRVVHAVVGRAASWMSDLALSSRIQHSASSCRSAFPKQVPSW